MRADVQYYLVPGVDPNVFMPCNGSTLSLAQYQAHGYDLGSVQRPAPDISVLLELARRMLSLDTASTTTTSHDALQARLE